jgi:hypothetical protein
MRMGIDGRINHGSMFAGWAAKQWNHHEGIKGI